MKVALLFAALMLFPTWAWGRGAPDPSFPCDKARTLDEKAICSDARLAELDRLRTADFQKAKRNNPQEAIETARSTLEARSHCGNDRVCILNVLTYAGYEDGSPTPDWVEGYRKQLVREVVKDDLRTKSSSAVGKRGTFALSEKGTQATLVRIDGLDTDHASAVGQIKAADHLEYCQRDPGLMTTRSGGKLSVEECVRFDKDRTSRFDFRSRADCRARSVVLWDGRWRFASYDLGITWIDPDGKVQKPWSGTTPAEAQFELLCPNTFARIRADALDRKR